MALEQDSAVDPEILRQTMRRWTTGVSIVTSQHEGMRHGMTVSSFTSIALDPPIVLVSLANNARTNELVQKSGTFAVTILAEDQAEIADRFAGRVEESADRFESLETFTLVTGAPMLTGGLACLDCRVESTVAIGTTTIFFGEVVGVNVFDKDQPLAYFNRLYRRLQK